MNIFKRKEKYPIILLEQERDMIKKTYSNLIKTNKGFYDKKNKRYIAYPKRYFKTYRQALKFLKSYINQKMVLSNYEPSEVEIALFKIFQSKRFMEKLG